MSTDGAAWQKVVDHINSSRVRVESLEGNQYPARTPYTADNEHVYTHMMNEKNSWDLWAYVLFDHGDGEPVVDHVCSGDVQNEAPSCHPRDL